MAIKMSFLKNLLFLLYPFILLMYNLYSVQSATLQSLPTFGETDPIFTGPIQNVTVAVGREALLSCSVTNLGYYKVGWMNAEDQTILSLQTKVVTHNPRISVSHDNQNIWMLRIRQIKESDRGCYMCQINTNTMKKQVGCIDVQVPPDINDDETSRDLTVQEGDNITLICRAFGHPSPRILWRREDGNPILLSNSKDHLQVDSYSGENLALLNVDRKQMGSYLCIASNDVPPAVSKRIILDVKFPPKIKISNHLSEAILGTNVLLECYIEGCFNTVVYWVRHKSEILKTGSKYFVNQERNSYQIYFTLLLRNFSKFDIGNYNCVAKNELGKVEGSIRIHEIFPKTTVITTMSTIVITDTSFSTSVEVLLEEPATISFLQPSDVTSAQEYTENVFSKSQLNTYNKTTLTILYLFIFFR